MKKPTDKEMRDMGYQPPSNVGIIHVNSVTGKEEMDELHKKKNARKFKSWEAWKDRLMDDTCFRKSLQWFRELNSKTE